MQQNNKNSDITNKNNWPNDFHVFLSPPCFFSLSREGKWGESKEIKTSAYLITDGAQVSGSELLTVLLSLSMSISNSTKSSTGPPATYQKWIQSLLSRYPALFGLGSWWLRIDLNWFLSVLLSSRSVWELEISMQFTCERTAGRF